MLLLASKAAIIYRAHQRGHVSESQARTGFIYLKRHGEAIEEVEDRLIAHEFPSVLVDGMTVMRAQLNFSTAYVAREMRVQVSLLYRISPCLRPLVEDTQSPKVVSIFGGRQAS